MSKIEKILAQEMTRKQFLLTMVTVIGGFFGLANILALLTKNSAAPSQEPGYGVRDYGP